MTVLAAAGLFVWKSVDRRRPEHRVYRIGWDPDPPFQAAGPDGRATGLAVELVREAARRRGIQLEWVRQGGGADGALRERKIDLWPLLTVIPERKNSVHITEPYLETEHCFLVRAESGYTEVRDLTAALISLHDLRINRVNVKLAVPGAKLLATNSTDAAIESVCRRRADAAFVDEYSAISAMLGGLTCAGQELLLIATPEIQARMGVGSTFAASPAADAIRDEIGKIASESNLPAPLLHWTYFSRRHMESLQALREAKNRQQLLTALAGILLTALLIVGWLTNRAISERQRATSAEKELDATQHSYRLLTEQAAEGVFLVDRKGGFLLVNIRLCEMLGYTTEEMLRLTVLDTCLPEERETARLRMERIACGETIRFERQMLRKDGSAIPIEASVVKFGDGNSQGIVRDVTERKRAEEALRASEERLRLAQQVARVGTFEWNFQTDAIQWTREMDEMHGLPSGGFAGTAEAWERLIHPDDRPVAERLRLEALNTGGFEAEWRVVWPDGTVRWLAGRASLFKDEAGNPLRLIGINLDITERKHAEAALRESEERFRNVADSAPVMIWVAGPDKVFNFFNKTWLDFVGRTMEQELNHGWTDSVHPDDLERCSAGYTAAFDLRKTFHIEVRLRRADGEYRWVLCTGVPRFAPDGVFEGYIGSDIDITDLKRAQEESLARQKLESMGLLAGGIAHDFNNLLGSILATSELVLSELPSGSPAFGGVQVIRSVADRGAGIVRQMMSYAGQENAVFERVDVGQIVREMVQLLKVSISKGATLKVDVPEGLPAVRANTAQIRQVVMNLVINASEALGEQEGAISFTLAHVHSVPDRDHIRLEVSDTGCGMTEEIRSKMFDPFFTTKFAGRGLGLAAVQGIVRGHGGILDVASAPGQGCRIEILLPCARDAEQANSDASRPKGEVMTLNATILVIEDEETLREALARMLLKRNLNVIEAGDGKSALELFRINPSEIDVALLDMTLPGMQGREVLAELRRLRPDLKVIITSAYGKDQALSAMGELQPWLYIRKPYRFNELMELLQEVCPDRHGVAATG
ncbi:MAG TPA: PAS domain S-box protein [Candidatus Solibacter sp.]|nr:PAS domain S-box protein [Candidatus Solibacter sp.]